LGVSKVGPEHIAAVIVELVQGEGGFTVMPPAHLKAIQQTCQEDGILFILDEVQSGFGRTGRWAAYEHDGIIPDISTRAKSMGVGMPIGAVMGRADIMDAAKPGTIGGWKQSGQGSELGNDGIFEYMEKKLVSVGGL
jgi:4-aminobutyrate aminotransferase/(S)-3-amino-2-methylpropionate transaminase